MLFIDNYLLYLYYTLQTKKTNIMQFQVPALVITKILEDEESEHFSAFEGYISRWTNSNVMITLDNTILTDSQLSIVRNTIETDTADDHQQYYVEYYKKMKHFDQLSQLTADTVIKKLTEIPTAVIAFAKTLQNNRFYKENNNGQLIPWRLLECKYEPRTKYSLAYVHFSFSAMRHSEQVTWTFSLSSAGLSIKEIFQNANIFPENIDLNQSYLQYLQQYQKIVQDIGTTWTGTGLCHSISSDRYSSEKSFWFKENSPTQIVLDNDGFYENTDSKKPTHKSFALSKITAESVRLPEQLYVYCFHLDEHVWLSINVQQMSEYQFKGLELLNDLILPDDSKDLISMLLDMSKLDIEDIVSGKKGGSFIMSTGEPGTGKTLTAEVFSESIKKPLYKVQCSQLGLDVNSVEKNLKSILNRASRWSAILLIDEADVYVRSRDTDIQQNAIVGVFLRTLEYYSGILFMTSNLEINIDDAIMSRATVHLQYFKPTHEERIRIFTVLSSKFNIRSIKTESDITLLASHFSQTVGRDIKAILKLIKMHETSKNEILTFDEIVKLSRFVPHVAKQLSSVKLHKQDFVS